ncbi:MAG: RNA polymerase sigma factor [Lachnospiraceae bacterium]|nr:RNA polymerase sigma factor [Lachnospiraceae bacterium]MBQ5485622.1 RNA polymerase sigma factor [Lachnospiraceae bacterium]
MDKDLLLELYQTYYDPIYRYLLSLTHDLSLAEDLAQETFLKAILSLPETHSNLRAWLYLVAKNLYVDHLRKERGNVHLNLDQLSDSRPPGEDGNDLKANEPLAASDSPEQKYIHHEQRVIVDRALRELSEPSQTILRLMYYDGFTQKEIAEFLNLTPGNIRVLALRGKKRLKELLEQQGMDIRTS